MGTGPTAYMASQMKTQPYSVTLQSPYISLHQLIVDVGNKMFGFLSMLGLLIFQNELTTDKYITMINTKLLIIHGEDDDLIPPYHSKYLYNKSKKGENTKLCIIKNSDHNNWDYDELRIAYQFVADNLK